MISAQTNKSIQESLINKLMRVPNMAVMYSSIHISKLSFIQFQIIVE